MSSPRTPRSNKETQSESEFKSYIGKRVRSVEVALEKTFPVDEKHTAKTLSQAMRYSIMAGGKRLRPVLCLAANEMLGGDATQAMPTALALEMIHTMSLIHDDLPCMDNDSLRRGKPTNHVVFGEATATLAGDALLAKAFETVVSESTGVPADRLLAVVSKLSLEVGINGLAGGQVRDLECENDSQASFSDLEWIHMHKTASLLRASVSAGAILAGATQSEVEACEKYAVKVGIAYQIVDDILDYTSTTEELGKTAGKDDATNKLTYVKHLGIEKSRLEAAKAAQEAKSAIAQFGEKAIPLMNIADYIINRKF